MGKANEFDQAFEQACVAGQVDGLVEGCALGHGCAAAGNHTAAQRDLDERGAEVCLPCLEQVLAEDDIPLIDAGHITFEEADVLRLDAFCDQGKEVEFGADPSATGTDGLPKRDLDCC